MKIFYLPDLGEGLHEAEIHEWYIKEGDTVQVDQPIAAMETAKSIVDVPSPVSAKILKLHGQPGDIIKTGAPLVEFVNDEAQDAATVVGSLHTTDTVLQEAAAGITPKPATDKTVKALPAVRALAKSLNVDINSVKPTGKDGQITLDDVKHAAAATQQTAQQEQQYESIPLRGTRRSMAQVMSKAHAEVVPVAIFEDANIQHWKPDTDVTVRIIQAIVHACRKEPALNAWYQASTEEIQRFHTVNIGLAVDTAEGLMVPVIKHAEQRNEAELRECINRYKQQARERTLKPEDQQGTTITLSNFGVYAGRYATPVVVPPTVAILGIGRSRETVVPHEGKPVIQRILPLSLTFDHRAANGGEATRFLAAVIESLERI